MHYKSAYESKSKPLRSSWTRRAFCNALGLSGIVWALPAYPLESQVSLPCMAPGPAPHKRIDAHVHIFNGTDLQIAGFLKTSVSNEFPDLKVLLYLIADPLQDFVWLNSPKAKDELKRLNEIAGKSGARSFSEQDFGPALQDDRAKTQAQYNEFLRQQVIAIRISLSWSDSLLAPTRPRSTPLSHCLSILTNLSVSARGRSLHPALTIKRRSLPGFVSFHAGIYSLWHPIVRLRMSRVKMPR